MYTTRYLSFVLVLTAEHKARVEKVKAKGQSRAVLPCRAIRSSPIPPPPGLAARLPLPWAQQRRGDVPQFLGDVGHQCQACRRAQSSKPLSAAVAPLHTAASHGDTFTVHLLAFVLFYFAFPSDNKLFIEK